MEEQLGDGEGNIESEEAEESLLSHRVKDLDLKTTRHTNSRKGTTSTEQGSTMGIFRQISTSNHKKYDTSDMDYLNVGNSKNCFFQKYQSAPQKKKNTLSKSTAKKQQLQYSENSMLSSDVSKRTRYKFIKTIANGQARSRMTMEPRVVNLEQVRGEGTILLTNGITLEGTWVEGTPKGSLKIRYPDKSVYQGEVQELKAHGYGKLTYPEGQKYVGQFCLGQPHGYGVLYSPENKVVRQGQCRRGKFVSV